MVHGKAIKMDNTATSSSKNGIKRAFRRAVLLTSLAAAPFIIRAQATTDTSTLQPVKDTSLLKSLRWLYYETAKTNDEKTAILDYVVGKTIKLNENPSNILPIGKGISLNIKAQKKLKKEGVLKNEDFVIYYIDKIGELYVFRKRN